MADQSTRIQGAYGSERVPVPEIGTGATPAGATVQQDGAPVPFNDAALADQPGISQARAAREARALRPDSSVLEGVGAAIASWDTTRLVQRLTRPSFENDEAINPAEYLQSVPLVLNEDERDYFLSVAEGRQSADYALQQIKDRRQAIEVVGDHPIAGFAASFVDPLWLAVPPAVRLGKASPFIGRTVSGASGAAIAGAVTASGEGPVSDAEIGLSMLLNGAASAALYRAGKVQAADPEFPQAKLNEAITQMTEKKPKVKMVSPAEWEDVEVPAKDARFEWQQVGTDQNGRPKYRRVLAEAAEPARTERRQVRPAVFEELPKELSPAYVNSDPKAVAEAVETALNTEAKSRGIGDRLQWNMRKTMASYGDAGKRIADLLYDNNSDLSLTSVESIREGNLGMLRSQQYGYEDLLRKQMAAEGFGTLSMVNPFTSRQAYQKQMEIERAVQHELYRRELSSQGVRVGGEATPPHIAAMADQLDKFHKTALEMLKKAGVEGAEQILDRPGYISRRWSSQSIDEALDRLERLGLTREQGHSKLVDLVALGLRRANDMEPKLARQVGQAIIDRTLRKGYLEDAAFGTPGSAGQLKELRDILKEAKLSNQEIERALNVLRLTSDDAGKAGFLKHRMDLDYRASIRVGNETVSLTDLIDGRVTNIVDQYAQQVSTQAALAAKGLRKRSDIDDLRTELLHGIKDEGARREAAELFDNTLNHYRGLPAGAKVPEAFRMLGSYTRAISLAWSGLWQATEYANPMAEYGLLKTLKYGYQELPGFRKIMRPKKADARQLNDILADHSTQSMRIRPYLARYEDGYEMGAGGAFQLSLQTLGQSVPYVNAMRYVHHHQAKLVGNLIVDRIGMAARGDAKARAALGKYGLKEHVMEKLKVEIDKHGFNVDAWDDAVWDATRPSFAKMMDAAVLKGRLGDVPAFAAFDSVGKFLFTYRTFVLTAHNKLLAGGLERDGLGAVGMLMLYQFPLAMAAVQAQSVLKGDGPLSDKDLVKKGIGQMGGLGLFSEPFKWATGESNSVGAPGLIAVDRGVRLFQGIAQGDGNKAGTAALSLLPVANVNPIFNAMVNRMKE